MRENDANSTFGLAKSEGSSVACTRGAWIARRYFDLERTDPPPETLRDAATSGPALQRSEESGKGEVVYTRRKWVKRPAPNDATITQENRCMLVLIRPDYARN